MNFVKYSNVSKSLCMISAMLFTSLFICQSVLARDNISINGSNVNIINVDNIDWCTNRTPQIWYVNCSRDLALSAENAKKGDKIVLLNNINVDCEIKLKDSVILDMCGFKITCINDSGRIFCGKKVFNRKQEHKHVRPGYYTTRTVYDYISHPGEYYYDNQGVRKPKPDTRVSREVREWHPEVVDVTYEDIYDYFDNIDIIIANGYIEMSKGESGKSGLKDDSNKYWGGDGSTPNSPVYIVSGTVRMYSAYVRGGDGGDGGNGGYCSLWHIPLFGGGQAGDGGDGGNGGRAIYMERDKCCLLIDSYSHLIAGKGGKGGKKGKPNPNYWLYSGWNGSDGKNGKTEGKSNFNNRIKSI